MFKREKSSMVVTLSDETRQALTSLHNDLQVVDELLAEIRSQGNAILTALHGSTMEKMEEGVVGVEPFVEQPVDQPGYQPWNSPLTKAGTPRIRTAPMQRRPIVEQYEWLKKEMADGRWIHPHELAKKYAGDERELRYLRSAISGRMRELRDMGVLERSEATTKGSMFRYRLIKKA